MGVYRISRNLEASIIDFLREQLASNWTNINIEKTFTRIYDLELPSICIRVGVTAHEKAEIGADSTTRTPQVLMDIFAKSDGMRLDLKDFLIEKIRNGIPYYEYTIVNGKIQAKTQSGRIRILTFDDTPINFDVDRDTLDVRDRFRHALTISVSLGRVET